MQAFHVVKMGIQDYYHSYLNIKNIYIPYALAFYFKHIPLFLWLLVLS